MTAEEIVEEWYENIPSHVGKYDLGLLIKSITTYGLQKQNEVLDKAAEVVEAEWELSNPYDPNSQYPVVNKQSILNLKNKI